MTMPSEVVLHLLPSRIGKNCRNHHGFTGNFGEGTILMLRNNLARILQQTNIESGLQDCEI